MKKILLNAYLNLNLGDDIFLKILFERYPDVEWILPKGGKKYVQVFKEKENVTIKNDIFSKVKRKLKVVETNNLFQKYDAGLYIGGSIFMQLPEWKEQLKERNKVINSFYKANKPYFILGSNFGPYKNEDFYNEYDCLFDKCKDICFRDNYSYDTFSNKKNVRLAPDIVFQLKPKNIKKIKDSVGISLIEIANREELSEFRDMYISKVREIIITGYKKGKKFTLFSFCEAQKDLKIINDVIRGLEDKYVKHVDVVSYNGDIDSFLEKFESMENIIGTRFHACILSQVFGQGLYPIIYSDKTYNVLKDIELAKEYCYIPDLGKLDINHLYEIIDNNKIKDKKIFKEAEKQFEELDKYVGRK